MVMWIAWAIWGGGGRFFLWKYFRRPHRDPQQFIFFHINKQVGEMVIMNDLEWPMLSYYVIYYEKFRKVMQRTEKEALNMVWFDHVNDWLYQQLLIPQTKHQRVTWPGVYRKLIELLHIVVYHMSVHSLARGQVIRVCTDKMKSFVADNGECQYDMWGQVTWFPDSNAFTNLQ